MRTTCFASVAMATLVSVQGFGFEGTETAKTAESVCLDDVEARLGPFVAEGSPFDMTVRSAEPTTGTSSPAGFAFIAGYGDDQIQFEIEDMTVDTNVPIYGSAGLLLSVTLNKLAEAGAIDLEAPLSKYIDWWTTDEADPRSAVTIDSLLRQNSGFGVLDLEDPDAECGIAFWREGWTITHEECAVRYYEESYGVIQANLGSVLGGYASVLAEEVSVGAYHFGCAANNILLATAIEHATGKNLNDQFREHIAEPLGVDENCAFVDTAPLPNEPMGSMMCSAEGYAKIIKAFADGEIVSDATMEAMLTPNASPRYTDVMEAYWGHVSYASGVYAVCEKEVSGCTDPYVWSSVGIDGTMPWLIKEHGTETYGWAYVSRDKGDLTGSDTTVAAVEAGEFYRIFQCDYPMYPENFAT